MRDSYSFRDFSYRIRAVPKPIKGVALKLIGLVGDARGESRVLCVVKLLLLVVTIGFLSRDFRDLRSLSAELRGEGLVPKLLKGVPLGMGSLWVNGDRVICMGETEVLY